MRRDPLAVLARLRGAEVMTARRRMAEEAALRAAAEEGAEAAARALEEEARHGGDYAAWLPRGLALRDAAAGEAQRAGERAAEAGLALAGARAAERAVEMLAERRAADSRRRALRDEQRALDEAAVRRPGQAREPIHR